ncbi:30S ribosomal protein S6 [Candidatus Saccharibacteria bacterium]|jgi:ribosomal protein S6|nr:30S ribosomal protein S6 [Candidatus Saccharibacteria bacterium]
MKNYELTVLIHPDLEANLEQALEKIRGVITEAGGEIIKEDVWGKKKLEYSIRHENFAVYVYFDVALPATAPLRISNVFNITDEVLRYLLVKTDERARAALESAKAEKAASEA